MSDIIASLRVALGLDSAQFVSGAKKAQRQASVMQASIAKSLGTLKGLAIGFTSAFSVGLFANAIKGALDYAGSLGEVSQQLGVTTRDLQVFRYAAGQVGVSQEQLETGLQKLTISMGKAQAGAQAQTKAFGALGISVDQLRGKDGGQVFRMIADGLEKIPDRAQRAAVEVALFGRSGAQLDNLLAGGSKALNELSEAADRLGIVLSDEQIQKADDTADKLEAVKTVLAAQIAGVVADNANSILGLANALGTLTSQIVRFLNSNPQLALGILGALLGGRVGGLPGAILGGAGGAILGGRLAQNMADGNNDLKFRATKIREALANYRAAKSGASDPTGKVGANPAAVAAARKELERQINLGRSANTAVMASRAAKKGGGGGANVPQFLAGGGGGGSKKGRAPREDHTARDQLTDKYRFEEDLRRSQADVLRAQQSLSHDYIERTALSIQMLDLEKQSYEAELEYQVQLYKLTKGEQGLSEEQAKQLKVQYDKRDALERQAVLAEEEAQRYEDGVKLDDLMFDLQRDRLESERNLAQTASERRKIELKLLDLAYQQERFRLEAVLADKQATETAKEEARRRLINLNQTYENDRQGVIQSTMGPWESYLNSLPTTAAKANEAMQELQVEGVQGLIGAIVELRHGFAAAREAAIRMLDDLVGKLLTVQLQKFAGSIFGGATGQAAGGMDQAANAAALQAAGATLTTAGGTLNAAGGTLTAAGGTLTTGAAPLTAAGLGLNTASVSLTTSAVMWTATAAQIMAAASLLMAANSAGSMGAGFASGGFTGNIPTNAVAGVVHGKEFVVHAGATKQYRPLLEAMNAGSVIGMKDGGYAGLSIPRVSMGQRMAVPAESARSSAPVFNVNVAGAMSDREARRTGMQIALAANAEISRARTKGLG